MGTRLLVPLRTGRRLFSAPCRALSSSAALQSGHNRWSKIRHDKAKNDAGKSKERTVLALNVLRASKKGGSDPKLNPSLNLAIANAKKGQLSKEAIEKLIAKGQGKSLSGAQLENVMIEAILPHGVSAILQYQSDNKARVLAETRTIITKAGGSVTATSFLFDKKGKIWFQPHDTVGLDEAMDEIIEAGVEEVMTEDGRIVVETLPEDITAVAERLAQTLGLQTERSEILYDPKEETVVELNETQASDLQSVLDTIEQQDDFQDFYINGVPGPQPTLVGQE